MSSPLWQAVLGETCLLEEDKRVEINYLPKKLNLLVQHFFNSDKIINLSSNAKPNTSISRAQ